MTLILGDRVRQTTTSTGTSAIDLDGAAPSGFQSFADGVGSGNTTYYTIEGGGEWEVGLGTVDDETLTRNTVLSSSNSDSHVDFAAGTKNVFCCAPASTYMDLLDLLYVDTSITTFTGGGTYEIGASVSSITFGWTVNKILASQSINQGVGTISPATLRTKTYTPSPAITGNITFTLTVSDGTTSDTATTALAFQNKAYWGTSAVNVDDSADILALAGSAFATAVDKTVSGAGGDGNYWYYCYPASFGDATFYVGGFQTVFSRTTVSFTNASGYTVDYYVYKSPNRLNQAVNIVVS